MSFELLINKVLAKGFTDVEVYSIERNIESIKLFNYEVSENKVALSNVYSVRALIDNKCVSTYVENINEDKYDEIAERLLIQAKYLENTDSSSFYSDSEIVDINENEENDFIDYSKNKQIELLKHITDSIRAASDLVTNTMAKITLTTFKKTIVNNKGLNKTYKKTQGSVICEAVVKSESDTRTEYAFQEFNNIKDIDVSKLVSDSALKALKALGATSLASKAYKVVLSNECMNTLLSAYSMHFSALEVINKLSQFDSKLGTKVFGDNVTFIDDPYKNEFNHVPFDDEGVNTKVKTLVEKGVLKTYLHNRTTAKLLNQETTGNGFKATIKSELKVDASNLYLKEGDKSLDEVFALVQDGLYITGFDGAHAGINQVSGNFNLKSNGFLIENGKLGRAVTLIIVSGNFFDMMNDVNTIASDLKFEENIGSPSVYFNSLNVSGK